MSLYVGINNTPKNIVSLLIGSDNSKKEISNAYTGGVNSKNLIYSPINIDEELTKVNPIKALTSGKITKEDIGKTVYLSNSWTKCQEWCIADINHDGTNGTVDLFPKYILSIYVKNGHNCNTDNYYGAILRDTLNTNVYNGFAADVQNAMKTQEFYIRYTNKMYNDKIKIPSLTEMGFNYRYNNSPATEGQIYPLFGNAPVNGGFTMAIKNKSGGDYQSYWTRSHSSNYNAYNICTNVNGITGYCVPFEYDIYDESGAAGIIRF